MLCSEVMEPDVLYAVRRGETNEALRYSLRSLANLPHRRVFIAGYCPQWVKGVTTIPGPRQHNKFDSIEANVRVGLSHPELGASVIYMNDDFYITQPIECVPISHGGPIDQYLGKQELKTRMRQTLAALRKFFPEEPLYTYDGVHMPLPLERDLARVCLYNISKGCLWRTWYGNALEESGEQVPNTKYKGTYPVPTELPTFLSTNNGGLKVLKERLEDILPKESPYV